MKNSRKLFLAITISALLSNCTNGGLTKTEEPVPDTSADQFSVGVKETDDAKLITISKNSLDNEFLLQSSITIQKGYGAHVSNPTSQGMKSRIVTFKENGDELLMFEAAEGMQPGDELDAHILLASFPIKEKTDSSIAFDFNEGMKNVIIDWDWYVSDFFGNVIWPDVAVKVENSYLRSAEAKTDAVSMTQDLSVSDYGYLVPIEVVYYLTPYKNNPNYTSARAPDFKYLGYFEANPVVQKDFGTPITYITKWDISKPVTYYLSTAIPEEYRNAVREGVLYWNKIFGKDILNAEMAPDGMTAPDFEHNIIQWHTDNYTGAYADAQVDPRTGEILHSQIFISSSFVEWAKANKIARLDRKLSKTFLTARQFGEAGLCSLSIADMFERTYLYSDTIKTLPQERIDAAVNDLLRLVTAHEVGHTLGLRHNFAASTVNEWNGATEDVIIRNYLKTGKISANALPPINSVMEYPSFQDDIITGAMINMEDAGLPSHDVYAINWGYFDSAKNPEYTGEAFCTDSQVGEFADCNRYDSGAHMVERTKYDVLQSLQKIPWFLSELYLYSKIALDTEDRDEIDTSTPSARYLVSSVINLMDKLTSLLMDDYQLLSIVRDFPDYTEADEEELDKRTMEWLNSEIASSDGIEKVMQIINPEEFQKTVQDFFEDFKSIINSKEYRHVALPDGGEVQFSGEELKYMLKRARELFPEVVEQLADGITRTLLNGKFKLIEETEKLEGVIAAWGGYVVTSGNGLDFDYSIDTRRNAISLLKSRGPLPDWLASYIQPIADELRRHLEEGFGMSLDEIDLEKIDRREREKIASELELYRALAGSGTGRPVEPLTEPIKEENSTALGWLKKLL